MDMTDHIDHRSANVSSTDDASGILCVLSLSSGGIQECALCRDDPGEPLFKHLALRLADKVCERTLLNILALASTRRRRKG
jgi:hypothetical protein